MAGAIQRLVGGFSEARDFIEALWLALPRELRRGTRGNDTARQLQDLVDHWDSIDLRAALLNLAINEIEDRAVGRLHRQIESTPHGRELARRLEWLDSYVQGAHRREQMLTRYSRED